MGEGGMEGGRGERDKSIRERTKHTSISPGLMIYSESEKLTECGLYFL